MAASNENLVESVLSDFISLTERPEAYLGVQPQVAVDFKKATKKVYDLIKDSEHYSNEALPELIVNNFDDEQIWQELELQNEGVIRSLLDTVPHIVTCKSVSFGLSNTASLDSDLTHSQATFTELKSKKLSKTNNEKSYVDETDNGFDEIEDDQVGQEESDTDEEITKIKSRLKSSLDDDGDINMSDDGNSDDLDFDFGGIGEEGLEKEISDESGNQKDTPDRITSDDFSEANARKSRKNIQKSKRTSVVDDKFFKLSQMEEFLEQEDRRESKLMKREKDDEEEENESGDSSDPDIFGDLATDDDSEGEQEKGTRDMKYSDYFRDSDAEDQQVSADGNTAKKKKKVHFAAGQQEMSDESLSEPDENTAVPDQSESSSEGEDMAEIFGGGRKSEELSNYEKRQERLKKKISEMEDASLADKPWQLAGEVSSVRRPENSLLEEYLQFDQTTKLPPVITEETTQTIEELIRQRIKDQAWDDVERKVKPKEDPFEYKKRIVLDQEKSKKSLGEIYEEEYLKQQKKEEAEQKDPDHEHIRKEMRDLFIKLDALCNFHFTPKQAAPDIRIISNLPSISVEEVAPVSASDATMLAPQEIQDKEKSETKGKTEKTVTDRKRERREKKAAKRARQKAKDQREKIVQKLHPGLGNKYSKEKALKELERSSKQDSTIKIIKEDKKRKKASTSSKMFFSQLQEEVTSQISKRKLEKNRDHSKSAKSSKKLKL